MKYSIQLLSTLIFITALSWAQSPDKMSYQAVVRDAANELINSQVVGMRISILQNAVDGNVVFMETHAPSTNMNGLVTIEIGTGAVVTGSFANIDWANDDYFIQTETDPLGGTAYTISGTSQMLSVPYALHARTASELVGGISETDPIFNVAPASSITTEDIDNWNNNGGVPGIISSSSNTAIGITSNQTVQIYNEIEYIGNNGSDAGANGLIQKNASSGRDELQIYADGDAFSTNSKGAGMHLYGNFDNEHAGNVAFLTGNSGSGDARMIIAGGGGPLNRNLTDTRVTIGNTIWNWVDDENDLGMLNLKNPVGRPAIYITSTSASEGEIAIPTGEAFNIGQYDGATFSSMLEIDGSGRVGIGTTSPGELLDVNGAMHLEPGSAPSNPNEGDIYMDAAAHKLRCYDGSVWRDLW